MPSRTYAAIDLKSFFASVECILRGLDPLKAKLVVADESRTEKTICLAVTPALKVYGIPGRARLFEVNQKVRDVERRTGEKIEFTIAKPQMAKAGRMTASSRYLGRKNRLPFTNRASRNILMPLLSEMPAVKKNSSTVCTMLSVRPFCMHLPER